MPVYQETTKIKKIYQGTTKIKKIYQGTTKVYSSGNIVTYHVDSGTVYQEEVDEGASCLSPKTFTPAKSGWTFVGWRSDTTTNPDVYTSLMMGDDPVTLYAVFVQAVTLSTIANGVTSSQRKNRVYNNGNVANPAFTVSNPAKSGASFLGWSSGAGSTAVSNSTISNLTLSASTTRWAVFKYANSSKYTLFFTDVAKRPENQNATPGVSVESVITGSPTINTSIYAQAIITISGGDTNYTYVGCQDSETYGRVDVSAQYRIGINKSNVLASGYAEWDHTKVNGHWNNTTTTINLDVGQSSQAYLVLNQPNGTGYNYTRAYMGNGTSGSMSLNLIGRTVVG